MTSAPLPDGVYDAFIVDALTAPESDVVVSVELTVVAGAHKGEVLELGTPHLGRDAFYVMGMPATLTIADGAPSLVIDD